MSINKSATTITLAITIASFLVSAIIGGIWLGNVQAVADDAKILAKAANDTIGAVTTDVAQIRLIAEQARRDSAAVQTIRTDQAVIRERVRNLDEKFTEQNDRTQKKLDALLQEIRRRNTNGR